jgi:hypothetical protein
MRAGLRPLRLFAVVPLARWAFGRRRAKTRAGSVRGRRGRAAVAWLVVAFLGLQFALNLYLEVRHPEVYDPEYRDRLVVLRERIRDLPDQPLALVVGSSRVMTEFRPEDLPPISTADGHWLVPFNLSHSGSGPLQNLMLVRRVLRDGFSPRWVIVEMMPPFFGETAQVRVARQTQAADLPVLASHVSPSKLYGYYLWERARAMYTHRFALLRHYGNEARLCGGAWDAHPLQPLGGPGVIPHSDAGPEELRRLTAAVRGQYFDKLQHLHVHPGSDRALRELIELCRQRQIGVVLLLTPESSEFRGWYSPAALRLVDDYCQKLSREYAAPLVDAREWLPDSAFTDGHHVTDRGAREFTLRLGREVLEPLADGRLRGVALSP